MIGYGRLSVTFSVGTDSTILMTMVPGVLPAKLMAVTVESPLHRIRGLPDALPWRGGQDRGGSLAVRDPAITGQSVEKPRTLARNRFCLYKLGHGGVAHGQP